MPTIDSLASISPGAEIASTAKIGPFCVIEKGVVIGENCVLDSHVVIKQGTTMGSNNFVAQGAVLGGDPQDRKYNGEPTYLRIGDRNVFREYVTIHRATGEGSSTVIGTNNYLMAYCHLGHNCTLHDDITMANNVGVAGHATIESLVNIGGITGIHQWTRVGRAAMIGGMGRISRDVPPFCMVEGENRVVDINAIGLRRIGVSPESRIALHKALKLLFKSQLNLSHAVEIVRQEVTITPEVEELLTFMERIFHGKNGRGDQR